MAKNKKSKTPPVNILYVGLALCIGILVGMALTPRTKQMHLATQAQKVEAAQAIAKIVMGGDKYMCASPDDPKVLIDNTQIYNKYLKINGFANRAVVRGCNDMDALLYKNKKGEWVMSPVNVALDARVNPKWQKACLIEDITVTDTELRPENSSIDSNNYRECLKLD